MIRAFLNRLRGKTRFFGNVPRRRVQIAGDNSVQIQMRATNGGTVAYHIDRVDLRRRADDE